MHEVLGVLMSNIFDSEVVDAQSEGDWSCCVAEKTGSMRGGGISVSREVRDQSLLG